MTLPAVSNITTSDESMQRALKHALGVGLGWATLSFALKTLTDRADEKHTAKKYDKKLQTYMNARYPMVVPATALELTQKMAGDTETSVARVLTDRFINPFPVRAQEKVSIPGSFVESLTSKDVHPYHVLMTLAAVLGGTSLGYTMADKAHRKRTEKKLDARTASSRKELDELFLQEYLRTRGRDLDKKASDDKVWHERWFRQPNDGIIDRTGRGLSRTYLLYAAGAMALAIAVAKKHTDDTDPRRIERKALENYVKERSMLESAPTLMSPGYAAVVGESSRPKSTKGFQLV